MQTAAAAVHFLEERLIYSMKLKVLISARSAYATWQELELLSSGAVLELDQ